MCRCLITYFCFVSYIYLTAIIYSGSRRSVVSCGDNESREDSGQNRVLRLRGGGGAEDDPPIDDQRLVTYFLMDFSFGFQP